MAFSRIYSAQTNLLGGQIVTIETDIYPKSLHAFNIVGLPDKAVDEAKDRVGSAIKNSGFKSPKNQNQKIIVSLSPADLKKEGSYFDLAIALGYLLSENFIEFDPEEKIFLGELSLNGELKNIKGALPLVQEAKRLGFKEVFLPKDNASEGALVDGIKIFGVKNLKEILDHLEDIGGKKLIEPQEKTEIKYIAPEYLVDFADIKGQEGAKRGLEIAAAGRHNIAMSGPPGTGKTMLARAFGAILPPLSEDEVLEITGIHSISGALKDRLITHPPFRSPHHTSSYVSIIGGGTFPKPGEVTMSHKGILFLDEFPEFDKKVLESLRQPLEDKIVSIARAKGTATFPSNFILIAAMNPCPCGFQGSKQKDCICKAHDLLRYQRKLSGPIMDRIDLWVTVGSIDYQKLSDNQKSESVSEIKKRVLKAREIQKERFEKAGRPIRANSEMTVKDIERFINLSPEVKNILNQSSEKLSLSARAYHRVIKLARTIADLEDSVNINQNHILEALQYRPK